MPRRPRIQFPDLPRHVIARGNNRQATSVAVRLRARILSSQEPRLASHALAV